VVRGGHRARPAKAPRRTTGGMTRTLDAASARAVAPVAALDVERTCEVCARTWRFERRAGQFHGRTLGAAALVGLAALTSPTQSPVPGPPSPTRA